MTPQEHRAKALRIERSMRKCNGDDSDMTIECAMLAGTHWLNVTLHVNGVTPEDTDVFHTYLLTVNEYRRLCVGANDAVKSLSEIEDLRPPYVRGNVVGGAQAAKRAVELLAIIRAKAEQET